MLLKLVKFKHLETYKL